MNMVVILLFVAHEKSNRNECYRISIAKGGVPLYMIFYNISRPGRASNFNWIKLEEASDNIAELAGSPRSCVAPR
jgi:hypothetical protein